MEQLNLNGVFDMHVHTAPDIRQRAYTDFELAEAALRVGAKGIVIKSHHGTTMNRAFLVNEYIKRIHGESDFTMYGAIVLNHGIGGLNPKAVELAIKMGAKVVWLPTHDSVNHLKKMKMSGEGVACLSDDGKVLEPLVEILKMVKEYDVVLGTGHLSPEEIFPIVDKAKNIGINKIVITHPEFWVVGMSHSRYVT
jgi:hypothetical protein